VLALLAERAAGVPFDELVQTRVCERAGMHHTAFLRSDELPARAAIGYLGDGLRSNVFHLPVRGSGDGGIYSTVGDLGTFWRSLFGGEIVDEALVRELVRPRSEVAAGQRYGLGFWLGGDAVMLIGTDAGVSFHSVCNRRTETVFTVISNTSDGARPLSRFLMERFG
jgi:CubicO group peptidase (beta-lactamase class C family)